ncbi:hypothetical protein FF38_00553, partial [Lucilia cuprina]
MQITSFSLIFLLSLFLVMSALGDEESDCIKFCPDIYSLVCGNVKNFQGEYINCTFASECILKMFTCRTNQELIKQDGQCSEEFAGCYDLFE